MAGLNRGTEVREKRRNEEGKERGRGRESARREVYGHGKRQYKLFVYNKGRYKNADIVASNYNVYLELVNTT